MTPEVTDRVSKATAILRSEGACEVYLFGSFAEGQARPGSDLDLAVTGLPPKRYFHAVGRLLDELLIPVDLIDLDRPTPFVRRLRESGRLHRVG